jgi:hypothetical protein
MDKTLGRKRIHDVPRSCGSARRSAEPLMRRAEDRFMAVPSQRRTSVPGRSATVDTRPKAEVHAVICSDLIEYSVIPAAPQSAAATGLNVFSDIRNCLEH